MLTLELDKVTENKFQKFAKTYKNNYNSVFNEVIDYHIRELKKGIKNMELEFDAYEHKYSMTTLEFYSLYSKGEFGDDNDDFLLWAGIYEIWLEHKRDLENLLS